MHLEPRADEPAYVDALRLQYLERLDLSFMRALAVRAESPKLLRSAEIIARLAREQGEEYQVL